MTRTDHQRNPTKNQDDLRVHDFDIVDVQHVAPLSPMGF
jgi:hypothetical protein